MEREIILGGRSYRVELDNIASAGRIDFRLGVITVNRFLTRAEILGTVSALLMAACCEVAGVPGCIPVETAYRLTGEVSAAVVDSVITNPAAWDVVPRFHSPGDAI